MSNRIQWTATRMAEARAMRSSGATWLEIAAAIGCSEGAVRYSLSPNRAERCRAIQARARAEKRPPKPKLFPYVGQYDPETGRQSW